MVIETLTYGSSVTVSVWTRGENAPRSVRKYASVIQVHSPCAALMVALVTSASSLRGGGILLLSIKRCRKLRLLFLT